MADNDNTVYTRQFALLVFILCFTFRVSRLPPLVAEAVGSSSLFVIMLYLLAEAVHFLVVYRFVLSGGAEVIGQTALYKVLSLALGASFFFKIVMACAGTTTYTVESVFENIGAPAVVLALIVPVGYVAIKGIRTIARTAEIISWFVGFVLILNIVFLKVYTDFSRNLPFIDGGVAEILRKADRFFIWFGDASPLLYITVRPSKRNPTLLFAGIGGALVIAGFALMNALYGEASRYVVNLVVKVASFNQFSDKLGRLDWTGLIIWMMLAVLYAGIYLWAAGEAVKPVLKGKRKAVIVLVAAAAVVTVIVNKDLSKTIAFFQGNGRWYVAACNYLIPPVLLIYSAICKKRNAGTEGREVNEVNEQSA